MRQGRVRAFSNQTGAGLRECEVAVDNLSIEVEDACSLIPLEETRNRATLSFIRQGGFLFSFLPCTQTERTGGSAFAVLPSRPGV